MSSSFISFSLCLRVCTYCLIEKKIDTILIDGDGVQSSPNIIGIYFVHVLFLTSCLELKKILSYKLFWLPKMMGELSLPFFKSDKTKYIHRGEIIEIWRWETAAAACHRAIPVYRTTETAGGSAVYADFKRALMMMIIMALKVLRLNFCSSRCLFTPISSCLEFLIFMW